MLLCRARVILVLVCVVSVGDVRTSCTRIPPHLRETMEFLSGPFEICSPSLPQLHPLHMPGIITCATLVFVVLALLLRLYLEMVNCVVGVALNHHKALDVIGFHLWAATSYFQRKLHSVEQCIFWIVLLLSRSTL